MTYNEFEYLNKENVFFRLVHEYNLIKNSTVKDHKFNSCAFAMCMLCTLIESSKCLKTIWLSGIAFDVNLCVLCVCAH